MGSSCTCRVIVICSPGEQSSGVNRAGKVGLGLDPELNDYSESVNPPVSVSSVLYFVQHDWA